MSYLTIKEIANDLGINPRNVYRYCSEGFLPSCRVKGRYGYEYSIEKHEYYKWKETHFKGLARGKVSKARRISKGLKKKNFLEHMDTWLMWCANGQLTGKAISPRAVELYKQCMEKYLQILKGKAVGENILSLNNLRYVLGEIPIESYSTRINVYSAVLSFSKYLIEVKLLSEEVRESFRKIRPKRFLPARKTSLTESQLLSLIEEIDKTNTLNRYQKLLHKTTLIFLSSTGLRSGEFCKLTFDDIDLQNRLVLVKLSKGNKNRSIGISKDCYKILIEYIKLRLEIFGESSNHVFLAGNGSNYTTQTLGKKFRRLSKRYGVDITPHGLRRTFVTINARKGKPLNHLRIACGHSDISTTQGYCLTSEEEVIEDMKNW